MGTTKHRKGHKEKLAQYKATKKREQELFKKKMLDNYIKMQQENLANQEAHTSTEEVSGPEINLDDLNIVEDIMPSIDVEDNIIDVEPIIEITNDNNN
jgi:hypothetical protein